MALDILLGLSDNAEGIQQLHSCLEPLCGQLVLLLSDPVVDIAAKAANCVVNLSANQTAASALMEQQSLPAVARGLMDAGNPIHKQLVSFPDRSMLSMSRLGMSHCDSGL